MNKQEFLNELEDLLQDIQVSDRVEAIQYYSDYFEDAGLENEDQVIKKLGSPGRVAAIIKEDLKSDSLGDNGEFTEMGYRNPVFDKTNLEAVVKVETPNDQYAYQTNSSHGYAEHGYAEHGYQTNGSYGYAEHGNTAGQNTGSGNWQQEGNPTYVYEYFKIPKLLLIIGAILFIPVGIPLIVYLYQ